jgi:hypothetical protein
MQAKLGGLCVGVYRHVWDDPVAGWRQHGIEIEGQGAVFVTVPARPRSEEDRFTDRFLEAALAAPPGGTPGRIICRHDAVTTPDRTRSQHFVSDHHGRPLLRTVYLPAGSPLDQLTEEFLRGAVAVLNGQ